MGGGSSPPQLQSPAVSANYQQQGINIPTAQANQRGSMVNQTNPYGSESWQQTGVDQFGDPIYASNLQMSPAEQSLLNLQQGTQGFAGAQGLQSLFNANYGGTDPTRAIGNETSGLTNQLMSPWLNAQAPFLQMQQDQLDTKLRNQGLDPNNPAYQNQMKELEYNQTQGVGAAASQFEPQAFSQASNLYTLPEQLALPLIGLNQPQSPSSQLVAAPGLNIAPADYLGAQNAYNAAQEQAYQAQEKAYGDMMSGLFNAAGNVAGAGIKYSDPRLKTDVKWVGQLPNGLGVYTFKFIGHNARITGLMSDEVELIHPEAVSYDANGFALVNYDIAMR